jgi:AcrR family transcriptional regulator
MDEHTGRQRRHAHTRQAILDAARELISERGPDGISLREIARRVDYSPAGIYDYFGSVGEIIQAASAEGFTLLKAEFDRVPADLPIPERLVAICMAYIAFAQRYPQHFLLIFTRLTSNPKGSGEGYATSSTYGVLQNCVQEGIASGVFQPREGYGLDEMCYHCWATVHGLAMLCTTHLQRFPLDFDAMHQRILEVLADSLCHP